MNRHLSLIDNFDESSLESADMIYTKLINYLINGDAENSKSYQLYLKLMISCAQSESVINNQRLVDPNLFIIHFNQYCREHPDFQMMNIYMDSEDSQNNYFEDLNDYFRQTMLNKYP